MRSRRAEFDVLVVLVRVHHLPYAKGGQRYTCEGLVLFDIVRYDLQVNLISVQGRQNEVREHTTVVA